VDSVLAPSRSINRRVQRTWWPSAARPVAVNRSEASRRSASLEIAAGFDRWPIRAPRGQPVSHFPRATRSAANHSSWSSGRASPGLLPVVASRR
jgi:hypothetical protein